jgi:hypothetical protein
MPLYSPAIISPVRDNSKPVASPFGLVVKKEWKSLREFIEEL